MVAKERGKFGILKFGEITWDINNYKAPDDMQISSAVWYYAWIVPGKTWPTNHAWKPRSTNSSESALRRGPSRHLGLGKWVQISARSPFTILAGRPSKFCQSKMTSNTPADFESPTHTRTHKSLHCSLLCIGLSYARRVNKLTIIHPFAASF